MVSGEYIYIDDDDDRYVCIDIMHVFYLFIHTVSFSLSFLAVMIAHEESFNAVIYHHYIYLFHHS